MPDHGVTEHLLWIADGFKMIMPCATRWKLCFLTPLAETLLLRILQHVGRSDFSLRSLVKSHFDFYKSMWGLTIPHLQSEMDTEMWSPTSEQVDFKSNKHRLMFSGSIFASPRREQTFGFLCTRPRRKPCSTYGRWNARPAFLDAHDMLFCYIVVRVNSSRLYRWSHAHVAISTYMHTIFI